MSQIKFWNSSEVESSSSSSGQLIIQNIEQGFLGLEKQYDLLYSVRYSILPEHSQLQHLRLYRIFSATKKGYFDPLPNPYFRMRIFIPCTSHGSLVYTEVNEVQEVNKARFLNETPAFFGNISCVVKTLSQFLEAVKQRKMFMVSFNDLIIFDASLAGYKKLIPLVNWENSPEGEQGECTAVNILEIGGADNFGNPIAFANTKTKTRGVTQVGEATPKGKSIQNQPANFGQTSQLHQPNQPIWENQPECLPNSQASTDSLSFSIQAVQHVLQSSQKVQMCQTSHPGQIDQIQLEAQPPIKTRIPAKQVELVAGVLKPVYRKSYIQPQPEAGPSAEQAPDQREQSGQQEQSEECPV